MIMTHLLARSYTGDQLMHRQPAGASLMNDVIQVYADYSVRHEVSRMTGRRSVITVDDCCCN